MNETLTASEVLYEGSLVSPSSKDPVLLGELTTNRLRSQIEEDMVVTTRPKEKTRDIEMGTVVS